MKNKKWNGKIWDGVYSNFKEAPGDIGVFDMEHWLTNQKNQLEKKIDSINSKSATEIPSIGESRDYCLSLIIAIESYKKTLKELDFGGGLAGSYLESLSTISNRENLEFVIVENSAVCKMGSDFFAEDSRINFYEKLPSLDNNFDIIHLGSSIQYIDDWVKLIQDLGKYNGKYLIFADLPASDNDTFVTIQNYYGSKIPVRFWNIKEFITTVESFGYRLVFKARYIKDSQKKNGFNYIDSINNCFESNYRLSYFSQLVFRSNSV